MPFKGGMNNWAKSNSGRTACNNHNCSGELVQKCIFHTQKKLTSFEYTFLVEIKNLVHFLAKNSHFWNVFAIFWILIYQKNDLF